MKKQLQEKDKAQMRKTLQRFQESGTVIVYGYAKKQSGSGIFSNERLILLNSKEKSVRYYSKDPPGLPFDKVAQIPEGKGKIMMTEVKNFKYEPLKGKTTDMKMEWEGQDKKKVNWIFIFENSKMMNEWIAAIQDTLKGTINKDPAFILANNNNQGDKSHSNNPVVNQKKPSILDEGSSKPVSNTNVNPPADPKKQQPNQNVNSSIQPPTQVNQSKSIQNSQIKPKQSLQTKSNEAPNGTLPSSNTNVNQNQNLVNKQPPNNQPSTNILKSEVKNTKEPEKINLEKRTDKIQTDKTAVQKQNPQKNQVVKSALDKPLSTRQEQKPLGGSIQKEPSKVSNAPTESQINEPTGEKVQYGDITQQLKALRKNNPQKFNLTNDLSKKNLEKVEEVPNEQNEVDTMRNNQSQNPYKKKQDPYYQSQNYSNNQEFILDQPRNPKAHDAQVLQNSKSPNSQPQPIPKRQPDIPYGSERGSNNNNKSIVRNQMTNSRKDFNYHQPEQKPVFSKNQMQRPTYQTPKQANNSRISSTSVRNQANKKIFELRGGGSKRWNQLWCSTSNPIDIYEDFARFCKKTSVDIIDQLPFLKKNRNFSPLKSDGPYHLYLEDGISFNMHYFEDENSPLESSRDDDDRAPILYDQQTYTEAKREFYNYNFLLGITGNKGQIKIPLVCYIQYKGVLIYCKANIPEGFQKVSPQFIEKYLDNLQQQSKIRFVYTSMNLYMHPQKKYYLISQLEQLIPKLPNNVHPPAYFRKQYLLENTMFIDNQSSLNKLYQSLVTQKVKQFVSAIESLQKWIINSSDLVKQLHIHGISLGCLPVIYEETNFPFFKKIIVSQMTKGVFCDILRSQLNGVYSNFPAKQFQELNIQYVDKIVLDCAHVLLDQLFSYSSRSENIWRMIVKEVNKKFKVTISKEDILPGYLLGGIMNSIGIECDYKNPELNRKQSFFIRKNTIPRDLLINFYPKLRKYDIENIFPLLTRVEEIISMEPIPDNYEQLVRILDLKNSEVPSFCDHILPQINTYLCNFVPLGDQEQYEHLGLYQSLEQQPHTFCSTKICLLSIKWAAKKKNEQLANKIFQLKHEENTFWVSQFNPAISQFYDFFALYNISSGNFEEAIKLAKSSLVNTIKLTGANSLPTADKHYQLGNIYFKVGRKQQALKQYLKTKQTLEQHRQTTIPQYGVILLKLSLLYLNFGKISDCVGNSLEALKIFDTNGGNQQQQIETFEILARSYQITRKFGDLTSVGALCSQKFNNTENSKIFERMIKIVLLPKLSSVSIQDSKILLKLISKLQELQSPISYLDAFNYLHFRAEDQIVMKKFFSMLDNITNLYEDINRKDLLRKHKSLMIQVKSEAAQLLVLLESILTMTGYNFVIGSLRDNYY